MTTVPVPAEPAPVPRLAVDPALVRGCAARLLAASAQVDDLGTFVAGPARVEGWTGAAATAYHRTIRPLGVRADAMSLALRGVARRVDAHGEEMARLERRREGLAEERGALVASIAELRRRAGRVGAGETPALHEEARILHGRADAHVADVCTEEAAMRTAFERVLSLEAVEERYAGRADPADRALAAKPRAGASPRDVRDWWVGLTERQRLAVVAAAPGAIGNLHGVPAGARHAANTVALDRDLADLGGLHPSLLTDQERRTLEVARATDEARDNIARHVDPVTGEPVTAQVYAYDPTAFDGDGRVAVAAGDLDTADHVAVLVPGLGTDGDSAGFYSERAATLYESTRTLDPSQSNATLAWIGYDAPDNVPWEGGVDALGVVREDLAAAGGARLADTLDGLRASRAHDPAHLTAIGHSYGSTTLGHGAHDHGLPVDDIVVVGSPGMGGDTDHARDLGIDPGHVWAGANSHDPVTDLGNHGAVHLELLAGGGLGDDPVEDDFGANRFRAESTTRGEGGPFADHAKYFDHDTESLHNISQVVIGADDAVQLADHVTDPWYDGPRDPERDREPTSPNTFDGP